jgi:hypothetical protein
MTWILAVTTKIAPANWITRLRVTAVTSAEADPIVLKTGDHGSEMVTSVTQGNRLVI